MIVTGDCLTQMRRMRARSVDAVVTDPPYDLTAHKRGGSGEASLNLASPAGRARITTGFMGKHWDGTGIAFRVDLWREVLRVLKPGGHLVSCGGPRTWHRMAVAIEDAGFEIRDSLLWLYGQGFPKSLNVGGVGTALKPGVEPIVLARAPLEGTLKRNLARWGTGGLNIDACRLATGDDLNGGAYAEAGGRSILPGDERRGAALGMLAPGKTTGRAFRQPKGRWPANVLLDEDAAALLDAQAPRAGARARVRGDEPSMLTAGIFNKRRRTAGVFHADEGGASRFFYVAKPSRSERDAGLEVAVSGGTATGRRDGSKGLRSPRAGAGRGGGSKNFHPTVKPVELMRWLIRLTCPAGGMVLDPFAGSGTTGIAAAREGRGFIGIERERQYARLASRRVAAVG